MGRSSAPVRRRLVAVVVAVLLGAVGCAAGAGGEAGPADRGAPAATSADPLPDATVTDVATGAPVELRSLRPADRPLLVWFWAPF